MTGATTTPKRVLIAIKVLHTWIWGLHAACVVALPVLAFLHLFRWAVIVMIPVVLEVGVLAINGNRCPLGRWAERYTDDRSPNYDIYLPAWLAANTKILFACLYFASGLAVLEEWVRGDEGLEPRPNGTNATGAVEEVPI